MPFPCASTPRSLDFCFLFVLMAAMPVRRLVDFPYVLVRLRCDVCKRAGAYRLARLAVKYGAEILLDDLIVRLSADCPVARRAARIVRRALRRSAADASPRSAARAAASARREGREGLRDAIAQQRDELALLQSITSSARTRNVSGTFKPSTLLVVRLKTRSNLVGCSTGRSAGLAPRRILST